MTLFYSRDSEKKESPDLSISEDQVDVSSVVDAGKFVQSSIEETSRSQFPAKNDEGNIVSNFLTDVNGTKAAGGEKNQQNVRGFIIKNPAAITWGTKEESTNLNMSVLSGTLSFAEVKKIAESIK